MLKIVLTGIGGQGIITASVVLAEAAVIEEGRYATQSQTYGAEARGGLTRADIIIADHEVLFPKIEQAHILAALHQKGYMAHGATLRPGGLLLYDEEKVQPGAKTDAQRFPASILDSGPGGNITMLGIICGLTCTVSPEAVRAVLARRYGKDSFNDEAFLRGIKLTETSEIGLRMEGIC